tara:strand:- start:2045 stop:3889 length:1845 start_codon:yes stop_codon:yes gene_type:complete
MAGSTFSGTGITDGQIIYDNNVSQSVDAFTNAVEYDITISGSLTLTGSLNLTGSLINEYNGQFKTLGIGAQALPEPTMLHIKTTTAGGDPTLLIETDSSTDDALLRIENQTARFNLGLVGSMGSPPSFRIQSDVPLGGSLTNPLIISENSINYLLQTSDTSVGIGFNDFETNPILQYLPNYSLASLGFLTSSIVEGQSLHANLQNVGINIHGTASYASVGITSLTSSYIQPQNIDFTSPANNITQAIETTENFNTSATSSFSRASMGVGGIATDISGNPDIGNEIISGSNNFFQIGDISSNSTNLSSSIVEFNSLNPSDSFIKIKNSESISNINTTLEVELQAFAYNKLWTSGSANPLIVVGPPTGIQGSDNRSASIFPTHIDLNTRFDAAIFNSAHINLSALTRKFAFHAISDSPANNCLEISSSTATVLPSASLTISGSYRPTNAYALTPWTIVGSESEYLRYVRLPTPSTLTTYKGTYSKKTYRIKPASTQNNPVVIAGFNKSNLPAHNAVYNFKVKLLGINIPAAAPNGVWIEKSATWIFTQNANGNLGSWSTNGIQQPSATVRENSYFPLADITFSEVSNGQLEIKINGGSSYTLNWKGIVELEILQQY